VAAVHARRRERTPEEIATQRVTLALARGKDVLYVGEADTTASTSTLMQVA
jgi:hypothetical protein